MRQLEKWRILAHIALSLWTICHFCPALELAFLEDAEWATAALLSFSLVLVVDEILVEIESAIEALMEGCYVGF